MATVIDNSFPLPENLPVPVDDGACDHLVGMEVPSISLPATTGESVVIADMKTPWTVVYAYPKTGVPGQALPPDWDSIPGARGCTPQNCAFRDHYAELQALGASVFGLSTQSTEYQQEMAERLHLPFAVLSDEKLELTNALRLPTFDAGDEPLLKRFSMVLSGSRIVHVMYPVFPSNSDAPAIVDWLTRQAI